MNDGGSDPLLGEVLEDLTRAGYLIGPDRFARLKPFGILSDGSRGSLPRTITTEHAQRLRFLLDVERRFGFERDRDGLAFELAFAGYPVVPWDRVQAATYKRPKATLTRLNVMIHKVAGEGGTYLEAREVDRAAKNLAHRYISKKAVREAAHLAVAHQALTAVFKIALDVMYLGQEFSVADIRRLLVMTEFPINEADGLASTLADSLNSANVPQLLQLDVKNSLLAAMHTTETDPEVWQTAFDRAHALAPLYQALMRLISSDFDAGHNMRFPEIETIPTGTESDMEFLHAIHTGMVGLMFMSRANPKMLEGIQAFKEGSPLFSQVITNVTTLKEQIPMVLRLRHGE